MRNYTPEDEELKDRQVPKAKPASGEHLPPLEDANTCTADRPDGVVSRDFWCSFVNFFCFSVEDKVKEQLEAANPEPIIEEVVGTLW